MYIIRSDTKNAYLTDSGWTTIHNGILYGVDKVLRFTEGETKLNKLPNGQRYVYFPRRRWIDV